jgi:hypothetical protein
MHVGRVGAVADAARVAIAGEDPLFESQPVEGPEVLIVGKLTQPLDVVREPPTQSGKDGRLY